MEQGFGEIALQTSATAKWMSQQKCRMLNRRLDTGEDVADVASNSGVRDLKWRVIWGMKPLDGWAKFLELFTCSPAQHFYH